MKKFLTFILCITLLGGFAHATTTEDLTIEEEILEGSTTEQLPENTENINQAPEELYIEIESTASYTTGTTLLDGLVSFWYMDETSGNALDSQTSGNNLTNNNSTPFTTGYLNNGADLEDSTLHYFSLNDANQTGLDLTGDFTISAWLKPESLPTNSLKWVVGKDQGEPNRSYAVGLRDISGTKYMETMLSTNGSNSGTNNYRISSASITTGTFKMYTWVYNSTTGVITGYINGSSIGTANGSTGIANTGAVFTVGRSESSNYFDGMIDELGIWNRQLTADEITDLYTNTRPPEESTPTTDTASTTVAAIEKMTGNLSFGLAIITTLLFIPYITWIWNKIKRKDKKVWDNF